MIDPDEELLFMLQTSRWPAWPALPIKHRGRPSDGSGEGIGVLWESGINNPPIISFYDGLNIWDISNRAKAGTLPEPIRVDKEALAQMVADGWMVD